MPVGKGSIDRANKAKKTKQPINSYKTDASGALIQNLIIKIVDLELMPDELNKNEYNVEVFNLLKDSIKKYGIIVPIVVIRIGEDRFRIISGYDRVKICKELGIETIKAEVLDGFNEKELVEITKVLNIDKVNTVRSNDLGCSIKVESDEDNTDKYVSKFENKPLPTYLL